MEYEEGSTIDLNFSSPLSRSYEVEWEKKSRPRKRKKGGNKKKRERTQEGDGGGDQHLLPGGEQQRLRQIRKSNERKERKMKASIKKFDVVSTSGLQEILQHRQPLSSSYLHPLSSSPRSTSDSSSSSSSSSLSSSRHQSIRTPSIIVIEGSEKGDEKEGEKVLSASKEKKPREGEERRHEGRENEEEREREETYEKAFEAAFRSPDGREEIEEEKPLLYSHLPQEHQEHQEQEQEQEKKRKQFPFVSSVTSFKQKRVLALEILSTGEKGYFEKSLRDLCKQINVLAMKKEKVRFHGGRTTYYIKDSGKARGWLVPRDLRRLDFSLFPNLEPQILPRRHCVIFALEQLRGVLTEERLILLLPFGADGFLHMLDQRLSRNLEYPKLATTKDFSRLQNRSSHKLYHRKLERAASPLSPHLPTNTSCATTTKTIDDTSGITISSVSSIQQLDTLHTPLILQRIREEEKKEMRGEDNLHLEEENETKEEREPIKELDKESGEEEEREEEEEDEDQYGEEEEAFLPFELRVIDSIMETVVWLKQREINELEERQENFQTRLKKKSHLLTQRSTQEELKSLRKEYTTNITHITNIRRVLLTLLDDEEDMALCNLSILAENPELYDPPLKAEILDAHAEVELLLESYLQNFNEMLTNMDLALHEMSATEALMTLRLDTARNQLLSYTTLFSLVSMAFAIGAFVVGLFGTNLESGLEDDKVYFVIISSTTSAGILIMIIAIFIFLYFQDLLVT